QVQDEIRDYLKKKANDRAPSTNEANDPGLRIVALETEFNRLNRAVAEARERFEQLDTRQFRASIAASSLNSGQSARIEYIDPAYRPTRPIGLSPQRLIAFGAVGSLAIGLVLAFALAMLDDRVYGRSDIDKLVEVLVEVPPRHAQGQAEQGGVIKAGVEPA